MIPAVDESLPHLVEIRIPLVHLDSSVVVSQTDSIVRANLAQLFRRATGGVLLQMKDGVRLGFRSQTPAADIRTRRRQQPEAEICEDQ